LIFYCVIRRSETYYFINVKFTVDRVCCVFIKFYKNVNHQILFLLCSSKYALIITYLFIIISCGYNFCNFHNIRTSYSSTVSPQSLLFLYLKIILFLLTLFLSVEPKRLKLLFCSCLYYYIIHNMTETVNIGILKEVYHTKYLVKGDE